MTRPSRGISDIQEQARGNKMKKVKSGMPTLSNRESVKTKVKRHSPLPSTNFGSLNTARTVGAIPGFGPAGMKKGGSCKGYKKGGSIDGCAKKGHTRGKLV